MPIETADKVSELNPNWPTNLDYVSQGDNHVRLIKGVMQADVLTKEEAGPGYLRLDGGTLTDALTLEAKENKTRLYFLRTDVAPENAGMRIGVNDEGELQFVAVDADGVVQETPFTLGRDSNSLEGVNARSLLSKWAGDALYLLTNWSNPARALDTEYQATENRQVSISVRCTSQGQFAMKIAGVTVASNAHSDNTNYTHQLNYQIKEGQRYRLDRLGGGVQIVTWAEAI